MNEFNLGNYCADPNCTVDNVIEVVQKFQVNEINKGRNPFSEYHCLFPLLKKYNDKFKIYTLMKLSTFHYILAKVNDSLIKNWCNLHSQPILSEERLVVTIRFLASGASYSDLGFTFRMTKSTISTLIENVLNALWNNLGPVHMPVPTENLFMNIAHDYYLLWDISHYVGALDVKHIRIKKPNHSGTRYFNYKKYYSITLQALVDAKYRFVVIDVGRYGHQHDATTFRHSSLYKTLQNNKIKFPEDNELYNSHELCSYFMIRDGAYPFNKNLLKPCPGTKLPRHRKIFNRRLSKARQTVECSFGGLSSKWRIFHKTIDHPPKKVELIVKGAYILHNLIIDHENVTISESYAISSEECDVENENEDELLTGDGEAIRRKLTQWFLQN